MLLVEYVVATAVALGAIGVVATCLGALWQRDAPNANADAPRLRSEGWIERRASP